MPQRARAALARLAGDRAPADCADWDDSADGSASTEPPTEDDFRAVIEAATVAVTDIERAAQFVDDPGIERLAAAVEQADASLSGYHAEGQEALRSFREFRWAAHPDQFHSTRGTSLGDGSEQEAE
jgi:hypothetical protein